MSITTVKLLWTNDSVELQSQRIEGSVDNANWEVIAEVTAGTFEHSFQPGLGVSETWYYRIVSIGPGGVEVPSVAVSAMVAADNAVVAPTNLEIEVTSA